MFCINISSLSFEKSLIFILCLKQPRNRGSTYPDLRKRLLHPCFMQELNSSWLLVKGSPALAQHWVLPWHTPEGRGTALCPTWAQPCQQKEQIALTSISLGTQGQGGSQHFQESCYLNLKIWTPAQFHMPWMFEFTIDLFLYWVLC